MGTELLIFEHDDFKKIRGLLIDGEPWLVVADVCRALGLGNPSRSVSRLDDDEKCLVPMETPGGEQKLLVVNESGFYALVLSSRKPTARKFRKWVTSEVLPSIRKNAIYTTSQIIQMFFQSIATADIAKKCVYILEMINGLVKIGCTQDFWKRLRQIETGSGLTVINHCHSEKMPENVARLLERICHKDFSDRRILGEFFDVSFEEACAALGTNVEKMNATNPIVGEKVF